MFVTALFVSEGEAGLKALLAVLMRVSFAVLIAGLSPGVMAVLPAQVSVEYIIKYSGKVNAEAIVQAELVHDGRQYSITEESRGRGLAAVLLPGVVRRTAQGTVSPDGLRPLEFRDRRGTRPEQVATFDWARQVVVFSSGGKTETKVASEPRLLMDRLSFLWTFGFKPSQGMLPGKEVRAWLADGRGLSLFKYLFSRQEVLDTPAGLFQTIRLVKQGESGDDRTTEVWLAVDRGFVPVRILVVEKDGTRTDQLAARISP